MNRSTILLLRVELIELGYTTLNVLIMGDDVAVSVAVAVGRLDDVIDDAVHHLLS